MSTVTADADHLVAVAAGVVTAYISHNHVQGADLPKLLIGVHEALLGVSGNGAPVEEPVAAKASLQQVRRSITREHLISFEDGKSYKTLRRHLTLRGLTPEDYRGKWGLPADYPMTCASYSEQRSKLAKSFGLGQKRAG